MALPALLAAAFFLAFVQAPSGYSVSGTVRDGKSGGPLPGARVLLSRREAVPSPHSSAVADEQGRFVFPNILPGSYRLEAEHPDPAVSYRFEPVAFELSNRNAGGFGLIIEPFPDKPPSAENASGTRRLTGRVIDAATQAGTADVVLELTGPLPSDAKRQLVVNPEGSFAVGGLTAGDYRLQARRASAGTRRLGTLRVRVEDKDLADIELAVRMLAMFTGTVVVDGAGSLAEFRKMVPAFEVVDGYGALHPAIQSDGKFEFQSFEGEYTIRIPDVPSLGGYRIRDVAVRGAAVQVTVGLLQMDPPGF